MSLNERHVASFELKRLELKRIDSIGFSGALVETPEHVHNGQRLFSDEGALLLADAHRR